MQLIAIDTLTHQQQALKSAPELRSSAYEQLVNQPLQPFMDTIRKRMPQGQGDYDMTQLLGLYRCAAHPEEALQALSRLEQAGSWSRCKEAVMKAYTALKPQAHGIELGELLFTLALGDHERFGPHPGYTGSGGTPGQIMVVVWPNDYNLPRLAAITAHEFHHNVRLSYEPWSAETTVAQYLVLEGLAEAFAAEMYGEDHLGPWVHSLDEDQHSELLPRYRKALHITGFNEIRGYMFGDLEGDFYGFTKMGIPPYAGYAIGYRIVTEYLRQSGKSAVEATYVPWKEIIAKSPYFRGITTP